MRSGVKYTVCILIMYSNSNKQYILIYYFK